MDTTLDMLLYLRCHLKGAVHYIVQLLCCNSDTVAEIINPARKKDNASKINSQLCVVGL